jgi:dienelactone hydrolase
MYGSGKLAEHPEDAKQFMTAVTSSMPVAEARFARAQEILRGHDTVDAERVAAIGYCFGGGMVLHMARAGMDLDGVASFHGSLGTQSPAQPGRVKASVLVLNGAADPFVPAEQVQAFEQEMQAAGVDYMLVNYPGVKHSFTNPDADSFGERFDMPLAYDADADADSWQRLQEFLERIFR